MDCQPRRKVASRTPATKQSNRIERELRKAGVAARLPFNGVIVTRRDVKRQRYLAEKGLPFSQTMASVFIGPGTNNRSAVEL